ncbi:uncharacterized protein LOC105687270 [Athalia rosae]|uniref:uncharacterized protein LOC105687270 n=1 Tax=Athalia rosae TaxID=37344 RepID=UPI0020335638|nr:uncharacterized protein LOC105687270 [Athalia rosae]
MLRLLIFFFLTVCWMILTEVMVLGQVSSTESSADYLFNVINQIQEYNRPSPLSMDRTTGPGGDVNHVKNLAQAALTDQQQQQQNKIPRPEKPTLFHYLSFSDNKNQPGIGDSTVVQDDQRFAESVVPHYQVRAPQKIFKPVQMLKDPPSLGLTRNDLAMLYRTALHQGSPVKLSSFSNQPNSALAPQIVGNQLRLNSGHPGYYYYFYPLKTFMNEIQGDQGYTAIQQSVQPDNFNVATESSEKQVSNPLFVAISGFVGMALIFMASVLFMPRFGSMESRNSSSNFFQLSRVAWEAIEGRNCSERFACELNRVAVNMELSIRSRRILENVVPNNLRRHMIRMRKSKKKRQECRLIKCRCD